MEYMCTKFGVDSSSRFLFRAQTNRQMRLNALPMPAAIQVTTNGFAYPPHHNSKQLNFLPILTTAVSTVSEAQSLVINGTVFYRSYVLPVTGPTVSKH